MTSAAPEQQIRHYLEQQGGQSEATVQHLLESFRIGEGDARGRAAITEALASVGVGLDRPLAGLAPHEPVTLWLAPARTDSPPPWATEAPAVLPPPWQTGESRGGASRSALIAVAILAAIGAAAAGISSGRGPGPIWIARALTGCRTGGASRRPASIQSPTAQIGAPAGAQPTAPTTRLSPKRRQRSSQVLRRHAAMSLPRSRRRFAASGPKASLASRRAAS